jgi:hypothetical protein
MLYVITLQCRQPVAQQHGVGSVPPQPTAAAADLAGSFPASTAGGRGPGEGHTAAAAAASCAFCYLLPCCLLVIPPAC